MKKYDEALEYFQQAKTLYIKVSLDLDANVYLTSILDDIGNCLLNINKPHEALNCFQQALEIKKHIFFDFHADILNKNGLWVINMEKHKAIEIK